MGQYVITGVAGDILVSADDSNGYFNPGKLAGSAQLPNGLAEVTADEGLRMFMEGQPGNMSGPFTSIVQDGTLNWPKEDYADAYSGPVVTQGVYGDDKRVPGLGNPFLTHVAAVNTGACAMYKINRMLEESGGQSRFLVEDPSNTAAVYLSGTDDYRAFSQIFSSIKRIEIIGTDYTLYTAGGSGITFVAQPPFIMEAGEDRLLEPIVVETNADITIIVTT